MTKIQLPKRNDVHVILDNGHGVNTPGKRSPVWTDGSQLFEYEFNRAIVGLIAEELTHFNIGFTILVKSEKDMPLRQRADIANNIYANHIFGISVHSNAGGGTGSEFYTTPGNTLSDKMATIIGEEYQAEFPNHKLRTDYSDNDSDKEARFYILMKTKMPFVLTENFFMDNQLECRKILMTQSGRRRIADFHIRAIIRIINEIY